MQHVMSFARFWAAALPLRPLMYATGAAVTAAGFYYFIKKRGDGEKRAKCEDTTLTEDPVQTVSFLDQDLMDDDVTQTDSDFDEEFLAKPASQNGLVMELNDQLNSVKDELKSEMSKLAESVQQLERVLSESHRKCEAIKTETDKDDHCIQTLQCKESTETLEQCNELVKESHCEAEEKYKSPVQMENEKSVLMSQVNTLRETVQELSNLLAETHKKYEDAKQEHDITKGIILFLQTNAKKRERCLIRKKKSIKACLDEAEKRYEEAVQRSNLLDVVVTSLSNDMHEQINQVTNLSEQLATAQRNFDEAMADLHRKNRDFQKLESSWNLLNATVLKDYEVECQAHRALKMQYCEMKEQHNKLLEDHERLMEEYNIVQSQYEEFKQHNGPIMVTLAEEKYEPMMECSAQPDSEMSDLTAQENRQGSSVNQLEDNLAKTCRKCDEITRELEREQGEHNLLKTQYQEMEETLKQCKELLKIYGSRK